MSRFEQAPPFPPEPAPPDAQPVHPIQPEQPVQPEQLVQPMPPPRDVIQPVTMDAAPQPRPVPDGAAPSRLLPWAQNFREVIVGVISLILVAVSCWMLMMTFRGATGTVDQFNREKDVLLFSLSLLGTVMGYYFGRVPAEQHAQVAHEQLNSTQRQLSVATAQAINAERDADQAEREQRRIKDETRASLVRVQPLLESALSRQNIAVAEGAMPADGGTPPAAADLDRARREIADLLSRLDRG
jgi:hypothetical protein